MSSGGDRCYHGMVEMIEYVMRRRRRRRMETKPQRHVRTSLTTTFVDDLDLEKTNRWDDSSHRFRAEEKELWWPQLAFPGHTMHVIMTRGVYVRAIDCVYHKHVHGLTYRRVAQWLVHYSREETPRSDGGVVAATSSRWTMMSLMLYWIETTTEKREVLYCVHTTSIDPGDPMKNERSDLMQDSHHGLT